MELQGKRIIVTGAARGMGAATVRAYAAAGANIFAMDINDVDGKTVAAAASKRGSGMVEYLHVNIADKASVEASFGQAVEQLGGLDVLAHPAAIHQAASAGDVSVEAWESLFAVNVTGTMLTNQIAYHHMRTSGGGSIINFGSISGQRPEPGSAAYSASKGAVHAWTRSAAGAWGADNVRVNAILPAIATPMYHTARQGMSEDDLNIAYWRNEHAIALGQKYGDPDEDLGPVMVFFASDASKFITGQLIPVDGGQTNVR
jgi:NAD(P)-dependent dehydrogenase (short-subunit alcohol dehydrogenase family)